MALELQPFITMLENYRREHQRRQAPEPRPTRQAMPQWARDLDPADFSGATRELLLKAQGAAPAADEGAAQLTSEELAALVPFDTRPRQAPVSSATRERLSPVSEPRQRIVGQEAADPQDTAARAARRDQVAREDAVHPHPGNAPADQPKQINFRKEFGPEVGGAGGSYIDMMRRYQQTGELPGGGGNNRPPANAAVASPTSAPGRPSMGWSEGQTPSAVNNSARTSMAQPTAARGGGGMGWRALLGGAGALMQELDGQQGAMGRFMKAQGARREANQTRQAAIDLGMDPELARTMPIPALTPLLSKLYEQRNAGPDYGFMNVDGTVIRTDSRGGTASPVYEGAGSQTIPGTNIDADSDMGRRYSAYIGQNFDHQTALGVASGRYDLRITDAGVPVMIDSLTNQEVPVQRLAPAEIEQRQQRGPTPGPQQQGQPQQAQPDPLGLNPQQQKTLYEMADSGTGLWNIAGDFIGRVGPQFAPGDNAWFPDQREAVTTIQTANRGLVRALQQSPRYAEGERQSIEREVALNPSIGMSPEAWRQSAVSVDRLLRTWWSEDMDDARSNTLAADERQRALASARAIERYLHILGVPQDGGQTGGQGGTGIAPGTIAVHPQTGQRIRLNESGEWDEVQ